MNINYDVVEGKSYREGLPELIEKGFTGFTIADYIENFVDYHFKLRLLENS